MMILRSSIGGGVVQQRQVNVLAENDRQHRPVLKEVAPAGRRLLFNSAGGIPTLEGGGGGAVQLEEATDAGLAVDLTNEAARNEMVSKVRTDYKTYYAKVGVGGSLKRLQPSRGYVFKALSPVEAATNNVTQIQNGGVVMPNTVGLKYPDAINLGGQAEDVLKQEVGGIVFSSEEVRLPGTGRVWTEALAELSNEIAGYAANVRPQLWQEAVSNAALLPWAGEGGKADWQAIVKARLGLANNVAIGNQLVLEPVNSARFQLLANGVYGVLAHAEEMEVP